MLSETLKCLDAELYALEQEVIFWKAEYLKMKAILESKDKKVTDGD